ncbi:hypothetical protein ACFE04_027945 [Oxalis oulophora]
MELQTLEEQQQQQQQNQSETWEAMARAWLIAFPEAKAVSVTEVESWIDSNLYSLPAELQSMPRSDIVDRLLSIQNYMRPPSIENNNNNNNNNEKDTNQIDGHPARFQRTQQWRPVYSWLESLNKDEVVKSKDITDWLNQSPEIGGELLAKHSKYHLLHYIKKCHQKILKRRVKSKGLDQPNNTFAELYQSGEKPIEKPIPLAGNPLNNLPKDSDLYVAKRNEALRKYEILLALEKKLSPTFSM